MARQRLAVGHSDVPVVMTDRFVIIRRKISAASVWLTAKSREDAMGRKDAPIRRFGQMVFG
jgi:hypothetical protein